MELVRRFSPEAAHDGAYTTEISFSDGGRTAFFDVADGKRWFLQFVREVCEEQGIVMGYNETETGFQLGFEDKTDYAAMMEIVEPKLLDIADRVTQRMQRLYDDIINNPPRETHADWDRGYDRER